MKRKQEINAVNSYKWKLSKYQNVYEQIVANVKFKNQLNDRTIKTLQDSNYDLLTLIQDNKNNYHLRIVKFLKWRETHELTDINTDFITNCWELL